MPRAVSLKYAMTLVRSENPPLVLEFGDNHYGAWVRNVQMHKGPKVVEGLTRAFPDLVEKGGGEAEGTNEGHGARRGCGTEAAA